MTDKPYIIYKGCFQADCPQCLSRFGYQWKHVEFFDGNLFVSCPAIKCGYAVPHEVKKT